MPRSPITVSRPFGSDDDQIRQLGHVHGAGNAVDVERFAGARQGDIVGNRRVGKEDRLRHVGDVAVPAPRIGPSQRFVVHADPAAGGLNESHQQVGQAGLPASCFADKGDHRPVLDRERRLDDRRRVRPRRIGISDVVEPDAVAKRQGAEGCESRSRQVSGSRSTPSTCPTIERWAVASDQPL